MKRLSILFCLLSTQGLLFAQNVDSAQLRNIYDEVLSNGQCHENLRILCKDVGNRISGSENAEKAVQWGKDLMEGYNFDKVYLQEVVVPK